MPFCVGGAKSWLSLPVGLVTGILFVAAAVLTGCSVDRKTDEKLHDGQIVAFAPAPATKTQSSSDPPWLCKPHPRAGFKEIHKSIVAGWPNNDFDGDVTDLVTMHFFRSDAREVPYERSAPTTLSQDQVTALLTAHPGKRISSRFVEIGKNRQTQALKCETTMRVDEIISRNDPAFDDFYNSGWFGLAYMCGYVVRDGLGIPLNRLDREYSWEEDPEFCMNMLDTGGVVDMIVRKVESGFVFENVAATYAEPIERVKTTIVIKRRKLVYSEFPWEEFCLRCASSAPLPNAGLRLTNGQSILLPFSRGMVIQHETPGGMSTSCDTESDYLWWLILTPSFKPNVKQDHGDSVLDKLPVLPGTQN